MATTTATAAAPGGKQGKQEGGRESECEQLTSAPAQTVPTSGSDSDTEPEQARPEPEPEPESQGGNIFDAEHDETNNAANAADAAELSGLVPSAEAESESEEVEEVEVFGEGAKGLVQMW